MSSELFDNYESEYSSLVATIRQRIETTLPELIGADRSNALRETDRGLEEAQELVEQMEIELLSLQGPTRSRAAPRIRQYKAEVERLKRESRKAAQGLGNYENNRRALLGDVPTGSGTSSQAFSSEDSPLGSDHRTRLLSGNERLTRGSQRLQESHRIAIETEATGANILNDLRSQREQIINTRDTLMQADGHVDRSQRTLRTMTRRYV
ncbi:V-snare-domain-containing protein [Coemansia reversa NRRL 1564]|uniref:V-snare-domain-containing protein n=1 Tax=Coemansia reversa (strain ATCC 12441 / NRRL 1564) TaxID=763665 RepID=A0A2G5B0T6_COERN|nr:V-snare-domain-containing protein [Coemansia reversa NRRL 1564]|eukprot:PIA12632.1 V-snare-domain-containing protein [Coemansia reversa NRRL 1564]